MSRFQQSINKRMGEGTLFTFEDESLKIQPAPTGVAGIDHALGIGGWPIGRIVELYGPESSGKTTLALQTISEYQRLSKDPSHPFHEKPKICFIDAEHALDPVHVANIGVETDKDSGFYINQPNHAEQAFDLMEAMIHSGEIGLIVLDSVAALVPKAELEGTNEDQQVGLLPRVMGKGIRKITGAAQQNDVLIIFINQIREKVGVLYGNPETTPGGRALKFFASVRAEIRSKPINKSQVTIGQEMTVTIRKNKVSPPFKKATVDYYYDTLFDIPKDIMNLAMEMGIIGRAGAYYYYGESYQNPFTDSQGNKLTWMGKDTVEEVLKTNRELFEYTNDIVQGRIPKDAQFVTELEDEEDKEIEGDLLEEIK